MSEQNYDKSMNIDPDWLRRMADKEDNGIVSVGGLVYSDAFREAAEIEAATPLAVVADESQGATNALAILHAMIASDPETQALTGEEREAVRRELLADPGCEYPHCPEPATGRYAFPHTPEMSLCVLHAEQAQEFHAWIDKGLTGAYGDYDRKKARGIRLHQLEMLVVDTSREYRAADIAGKPYKPATWWGKPPYTAAEAKPYRDKYAKTKSDYEAAVDALEAFEKEYPQ